MNKFVSIAVLLLAATSLSSYAGVNVSEGNVLQLECDFPRGTDIRSIGTLTQGGGYIEKNKKVSTGQSVMTGDVIFYVALEKSRTSYISPKNINIKDKGIFTRDILLSANQKYPVWRNYTKRSTGEKFALLDINDYAFVVVKEDGFLCSNMIGEGMSSPLSSLGMPQVYQELPFTKSEEPTGDGKTIAIAITLKELDSVSFTLDIAVLANGKVASRKSVAYDMFVGTANLGSLTIDVAPNGKTALRIKSIAEPMDYSRWLNDVFGIN